MKWIWKLFCKLGIHNHKQFVEMIEDRNVYKVYRYTYICNRCGDKYSFIITK